MNPFFLNYSIVRRLTVLLHFFHKTLSI